MTDYTNGIVVEARKSGLKQAKRKGPDGDWYDYHDVTFEVHPNDTTSPLSNMPLGTRVALVVTPLVDGAVETTDEHSTPEATETPEKDSKATAMWSEAKRRMVQRAALVCKETTFQNYIARGYHIMWNHERHKDASPEDRAAYHVRAYCGVKSRSEIDPAEKSGAHFRDLMRRYEASQRGETPEELARQAVGGPR